MLLKQMLYSCMKSCRVDRSEIHELHLSGVASSYAFQQSQSDLRVRLTLGLAADQPETRMEDNSHSESGHGRDRPSTNGHYWLDRSCIKLSIIYVAHKTIGIEMPMQTCQSPTGHMTG